MKIKEETPKNLYKIKEEKQNLYSKLKKENKIKYINVQRTKPTKKEKEIYWKSMKKNDRNKRHFMLIHF